MGIVLLKTQEIMRFLMGIILLKTTIVGLQVLIGSGCGFLALELHSYQDRLVRQIQCYNNHVQEVNTHVQVVNNNEDLLCWSQLEHLCNDIPLDSTSGEDFRGYWWLARVVLNIGCARAKLMETRIRHWMLWSCLRYNF